MRSPLPMLATVIGLAVVTHSAGAQSGFWLTGVAPGGTSSSARALSQNGSVAAGGSLGPGVQPGFTWSLQTDRTDFAVTPSPASGLSSNGAIAAGWMGTGETRRAYRTSVPGPLQDLGLLPNETRSYARDISGDGNTVVGAAEHGQLTEAFGQAFRWTQQTGMQPLGYLRPNGTYSVAEAISRDGGTIVGTSQSGGTGGTYEAFVWTAATAMQGLPRLTGALNNSQSAEAVNLDGTVIVGSAASGAPTGNSHAVRWSGGAVLDLGVLPSKNFSHAFAISNSGDVVGGASTGPGAIAFVWTSATGMVPASEYLAANGVAIPFGWNLEYVYAISGDGLTFAGEARSSSNVREGFIATIPAPATTTGLCFMLLARRRRR